MAEFNFVELAKELDEVEETGVNFALKSLKWQTEEEVKPLIKEMDKCSKLVYLNLEGNTLGVEAAKSISKALEKHPEFKKALWKDLFTGRLKTEIPEALKYLGKGITTAGANLTVLDCSDNALGPNGMTGLVDLLRSSACYSLQELKLNNCGLGIQGGKMLAKALLECHTESIHARTPFALKVFIAGRNRLENAGAKALAEVFSAVKTLEEVALPQNGIYHEGITAMSKAFIVNRNMRILNLNDNTITEKGAESLAKAIPCMQKLREIDFGDCLLKTNGAMLLSAALFDGHSDLEVVNFSANELGPDGGIALTTAILNKSKIRSILLDANNFGFEGRERIKELMQESMNPNALGSLEEDDTEEDDEDGDEEDEETETGEEEDYEEDANNRIRSDEEQYGNDTEEEDLEGLNYVTALNTKALDTTTDQSFVSDNSIIFAGEEYPPNTIEAFCKTEIPSLKMFNSLEEIDKIEAFKRYLETRKDDYLQYLVFTILKCSALSEDSSDALDVAMELYKDAFAYAQETQQVTRVKNFFLIQLGFLKCEDKSFKPKYNLKACRHALRQTLDNNAFPKEIRGSFDLFFERFG